MNWTDQLLAKDLLPELLVRQSIRLILGQRLRELERGGVESQGLRFQALVESLRQSPIAIKTATANSQHYELPTSFFHFCLGARLKYSCGLWGQGTESLDRAEETMLALVAERARLADGQKILDLGCGWGSMTLWMAEKFPRAHITAVSNSTTQREYIEKCCRERNLSNVRVITADVNFLRLDHLFDRIVSIEMLEHMRNYEMLFEKLGSWLTPGGFLFVHIFAHRTHAYCFAETNETDWMGRYFFSGGIMPSHDLLLYVRGTLHFREQWKVQGQHYQKTAEAWLANMKTNESEIMALFRQFYGKDSALQWWAYWKIFFMACAELWGYREGNEWHVSHYLFER